MTECIQTVLLAVNAVLIFFYLRETKRIRETSQQQVEEIKKQVAIGQAQREDAIRPAVVLYQHGDYRLLNVGNGTGVNLKIILAQEGVEVSWDAPGNIGERRNSFVSPREMGVERAQWKSSGIPAGFFEQNPGKSVQIIYESLSGRKYATIMNFDSHGEGSQTRFLTRD